MKNLIGRTLLIAFAWAHEVRGQAPDSLAGKVFHEVVFAVTTRNSWSRITELKADGRATDIKSAIGHALNSQASYDFFLSAPRTNLTYRYTVTGSDTATLLFADTTWEDTYLLKFSSAIEGSILSGLRRPVGGTLSDSFGLGFTDVSASFSLSESTTFHESPATNVSLRGSVAPGRSLIAGFVIPGTKARNVLIRVVGPSLSQLGVTGHWTDPDFDLFRDGARAVRRDIHYRDWSSTAPFVGGNLGNPTEGFRNLFSYVGAFPLLPESKDAAEIVRLEPGGYTIVASVSAGDVGGEALIELYFLP